MKFLLAKNLMTAWFTVYVRSADMSSKKTKTTETIKLGTFEIVSGKVRISDPCYDKKTWCAGTLDNVATGTWKAKVVKIDRHDGWGNRCRKLIATHESFDSAMDYNSNVFDFEIGVDSGQAGIFDDKFYKKNYKEDYLQVGRQEYERHSYKHSAKLALANAEARLLMAKDKLSKAMYQDKIDYIKSGKYVEDHLGKPESTKDWYEVCCDKTLSDVGAGVINYGCVSSSGDGDGSYDGEYLTDSKGRVVSIKINF
jgi:hypothetical protein